MALGAAFKIDYIRTAVEVAKIPSSWDRYTAGVQSLTAEAGDKLA